MAISPDTFHRKIKAIRTAQNLSGSEFAQKLGVSVDTLRSWESGRKRPEAENFLKLADLASPEWKWEILKEIGLTPRRVRAWLRRAAT